MVSTLPSWKNPKPALLSRLLQSNPSLRYALRSCGVLIVMFSELSNVTSWWWCSPLGATASASFRSARTARFVIGHRLAGPGRATAPLCARSWHVAVRAAPQPGKASSAVRGFPDRPSGWLHQAYALRRAPGGSVQQAWDALLPVVQKFPREPIVPYNLACYACQLGRVGPARIWLKRALAMADKDEMKRQALADRDLEPLWGEIPGF